MATNNNGTANELMFIESSSENSTQDDIDAMSDDHRTSSPSSDDESFDGRVQDDNYDDAANSEDHLYTISNDEDEDASTPFVDKFSPNEIHDDNDIDYDISSPAESSEHTPCRDPDLLRVVLEFLISEGHKDTAMALCQDTGVTLSPDEGDFLDRRVAIKAAVQEGRIKEAVEKINELCPTLLETDSKVSFSLMKQELIELVRSGDSEEAIKFGQAKVASKLPVLTREQLEHAFALLAFENPETSSFGELMAQEQREKVATAVNAAILAAVQKPSKTKIEALFKMMVFVRQQMHINRNPDEPMADDIKVAMNLFPNFL